MHSLCLRYAAHLFQFGNKRSASGAFKGIGTPREAPKNVFWNVSVFSSDSGGEMIAFASSMH